MKLKYIAIIFFINLFHTIAYGNMNSLTYYLGKVMSVEKNHDLIDLEEDDVHYNWDLGKFFVNGYTRVFNQQNNPPIFLKNAGDQVALWFNLQQNINHINDIDSLSVANGGIDKTDEGKGTLTVKFIDYQNLSKRPVIYTDYLSALTVGADTKVKLFEEGDYEIILDYKLRNTHLNVDNLLFWKVNWHTLPTHKNYRIKFKFSVRNGNCMIFMRDVKTHEELTSFAPNGFYLDLTKSRYLDINVKKEVLQKGSNKLDVRFNRPAKDGDQYTEEGLYTITIKNRYTDETTTKVITVNSNPNAYISHEYQRTESHQLLNRNNLSRSLNNYWDKFKSTISDINLLSEQRIRANEIKTLDQKSDLSDELKMQQEIQDDVYVELEKKLDKNEYTIQEIKAIYVSKEYLEEFFYNTRPNNYFGYELAELEKQFHGEKYVFTVGNNHKTIVRALEEGDNTIDQILKNIAVGSGAIVVCATVSAVTGGIAPTMSVVFMAAAEAGTVTAISSALCSSVICGAIKGIQTKDFKNTLQTMAVAGSEGFKWGAIAGVVTGGISKALEIRKVASNIRSYRESEARALVTYGGRQQVSYLNGKEVPQGTLGAVRPDLMRTIDGHWEAIEVKNYDLQKNSSSLCDIIKSQVKGRLQHLPAGTTQRIALDVKGRNYSQEFLADIVLKIQNACKDIYPNLPVDILA